MSISANEFLGENDDDNSDSDTNNLDDDGPDYYQPISTDDDEDVDHGFQMISSNGHIEPEIGIHTLDLNHEEEEETIEDEEEEASNSEISRAFIEDENRRNAPLTPENSNRIMNAMRGISFQAGFVPDWINQVPDDRWIDHLTNLRQLQPNSTSTSSTTAAQN